MQDILRIKGLPESALEASSAFHEIWLPRVRASLESCDSLVIVLAPADYDQTDWRRAAARDAARKFGPKRVNAVSGDDETRISAACEYLCKAPGVTGQYLPLDGSDC